jgi:hypothetical protein
MRKNNLRSFDSLRSLRMTGWFGLRLPAHFAKNAEWMGHAATVSQPGIRWGIAVFRRETCLLCARPLTPGGVEEKNGGASQFEPSGTV